MVKHRHREFGNWDNVWTALCLYFTYKSLRVTPGMQDRITNHDWDIAELISFS
jgi:hypothetical protein